MQRPVLMHLASFQTRVHEGVHQYHLAHPHPRLTAPPLARLSLLRDRLELPLLGPPLDNRMLVALIARLGLLHDPAFME